MDFTHIIILEHWRQIIEKKKNPARPEGRDQQHATARGNEFSAVDCGRSRRLHRAKLDGRWALPSFSAATRDAFHLIQKRFASYLLAPM